MRITIDLFANESGDGVIRVTTPVGPCVLVNKKLVSLMVLSNTANDDMVLKRLVEMSVEGIFDELMQECNMRPRDFFRDGEDDGS